MHMQKSSSEQNWSAIPSFIGNLLRYIWNVNAFLGAFQFYIPTPNIELSQYNYFMYTRTLFSGTLQIVSMVQIFAG